MSQQFLLRELEVRPPPEARKADFWSEGAEEEIRFGRFFVIPGARCLLHDGRQVEIGGRAFDLLIVLLRARGALVSKNEIMNYVWPSRMVDESNLRFQMAALRRALGEYRDAIKTVPGRGYFLSIRPKTGCPPITDAATVYGPPSGDVESIRTLFRSAGLRVETFASVGDVMAGLHRDRPKYVLIDMQTLSQRGLDALIRLAKADLRICVILLTDDADVPVSLSVLSSQICRSDGENS